MTGAKAVLHGGGRPGGAVSGTIDLDGEAVRVALRGELDVATSGQVQAALGCLLAGGVTSIVVDLEEVTFADCAGLRPVWQAAATAGATVRVDNPSPLVRRVLALTGTGPALGVRG